MCGIAGILGDKIGDRITEMVKALTRRGPDDSGIWTSKCGSMSLGHSRLSIIDLSETGHQPMCLDDECYCIVYNGEIYNYIELRKDLELLGFKFLGSSDTEVLLLAWKAWGEGVLPRLRGMFAFGIWDKKAKELILCRDRMGIKPLIYSSYNGQFVFGSSLDSLISSGIIPKRICRFGLYDLFSLGSVMQPRTIVKGVWSLEPGTILKVNTNGITVSSKYWTHSANEKLKNELLQIDYKDQVSILRSRLEDACRYHMIADVKVGSFLSGGVDSTAVTALMSRVSGQRISTFSIGFDNNSTLKNELIEAAEAAKYLNCDHHQLVLNGEMVNNNFDDFISVIDQPSYDGINTYWVSKLASEYVKVALSGLGGDELFGGYDHFKWAFMNYNSYSRYSIFLKLYRKHPSRLARLKNLYLRNAGGHGRLATLRRLNYNEGLKKILSPELINELPAIDWVLKNIEESGLPNETDMFTLTQYECDNYLVNTLLRDSDSLSMGHSLEVRPVLLDNILISFALSLPPDSKIRQGRTKAILKDACSDLLPHGFFRRKKKGFTLPTGFWLRHDLKERFQYNILHNNANQFFNPAFIEKSLKGQLESNYSLTAWLILVFLEWVKAKNMIID